MKNIKGINWFKENMSLKLNQYDIQYRFYKEGDFGSLNQVIIESSEKGAVIDFWGLGWLGVTIYDYKKDQQLLNVLFDPNQYIEQERYLKN